MRKSTLIRVGCLAVAAFVLSGALMVAAFSGSPYETLKRSVLDAMMLQNGTVKSEFSYSIDGVQKATDKSDDVITENGNYSKRFDGMGAEAGFNYNSKALNIRSDYTAPDGTQWYSGYVPSEYDSVRTSVTMFGIGGLSTETRSSASMRFIELAVDALVGDLKNNVTMSEENGVRHISGTLTESQIPELARAGMDMLTEQSGGYYSSSKDISVDLATGKRVYEQVSIGSDLKKTVRTFEQDFRPVTEEIYAAIYSDRGYNGQFGDYYGTFYYPQTELPDGGRELNENSVEYMITSDTQISEYTTDATRADYNDRDPMNMPLQSVVVNYVHGEADIDANGNLMNITANGTALVTNKFGESFTLELRGTVSLANIGSSYVSCPIPGAEQVLTRDFIKDKIGNNQRSFYFTLNADGTVDRSSITTQWPGEKDRIVSTYWSSDKSYTITEIGTDSVTVTYDAPPAPEAPAEPGIDENGSDAPQYPEADTN